MLIGITVGVYFGNVSINTLIQINGAVVGFFFIYLLPAVMHLKCLYWKSFGKDFLFEKKLVDGGDGKDGKDKGENVNEIEMQKSVSEDHGNSLPNLS